MNLANLRVRTLLYGGFGTILAILLVLQTISHVNFKNVSASVLWNKHTYNVIIAVDAILTSLVNIETGQRGFIVTGKDEALEPLNSGMSFCQTTSYCAPTDL